MDAIGMGAHIIRFLADIDASNSSDVPDRNVERGSSYRCSYRSDVPIGTFHHCETMSPYPPLLFNVVICFFSVSETCYFFM